MQGFHRDTVFALFRDACADFHIFYMCFMAPVQGFQSVSMKAEKPANLTKLIKLPQSSRSREQPVTSEQSILIDMYTVLWYPMLRLMCDPIGRRPICAGYSMLCNWRDHGDILNVGFLLRI